MYGTLSHEIEVNVPASEAWELYGTLRLAKLTEKELSFILERIDLVEGDGGVGTVLHLHFVPGVVAFSSYKEKFTKIDNENRVKEAEVVEGGYLDFGFTLYRVRFEITEKSDNSCITKSTIEYDLNEEAADNLSLVSIQALAKILEISATHLINSNKIADAKANLD